MSILALHPIYLTYCNKILCDPFHPYIRATRLAAYGLKALSRMCEIFLTGESNFIKTLVNFDKSNISDRVLKKIGQYCRMSDFQPEIIGKVSLAAKSLCMWVRAMEVRAASTQTRTLLQAWKSNSAIQTCSLCSFKHPISVF